MSGIEIGTSNMLLKDLLILRKLSHTKKFIILQIQLEDI